MYSTCLFCHRSLGANDVVETFPVGRTLAFDAAKGRLWVICPRCARWNLTPLEERWEAVETCERLFRGTSVRVATDEIGLTRLPEGLELVRIGKPLRPEFAAWRYGRRFVARHQRYTWLRRGGTAGRWVWGCILYGPLMHAVHDIVPGLAGPAMLGGALALTGIAAGTAWDRRTVLRLPNGRGVLAIRGRDLAHAGLLDVETDAAATGAARDTTAGAEAALGLRIVHADGTATLRGAPARRAAAAILARLNWRGESDVGVQSAVEVLAAAGSAEQYVADLLARQRKPRHPVLAARARTAVRSEAERAAERREVLGVPANAPANALVRVTPLRRLALEMALHEAAEHRAATQDLAALAEAWREAEEIAAIADDLVLPATVRARWEALRGV